MDVCVIGGGGQIAEGIGTLMRQRSRSLNVSYYRLEQVAIPGVPARPRRPRSYFDEISVVGSGLTAIESATIRNRWSDEQMMQRCDIFVFAMPSYLAEHTARLLAKYLSGKVLINISDRFLGTYAMNNEVVRAGYTPIKMGIAFNSPPIIAYQPQRNEQIRVYYDKASVHISCFPPNEILSAIGIISDVFGIPKSSVKAAPSLLYLAFENTQSIVHAVQDLENLQRGNYCADGFGSRYDESAYTEKMVRRVKLIIEERDVVASFYLNTRTRSLFDYDRASDTIFCTNLGIAYGTAVYRQCHPVLRMVPRPSVYYAHGYEDVGWAMVPLESFARIARLETPHLSRLITDWSRFMMNNYRATGRTARTLNLVQDPTDLISEMELLERIRGMILYDYRV